MAKEVLEIKKIDFKSTLIIFTLVFFIAGVALSTALWGLKYLYLYLNRPLPDFLSGFNSTTFVMSTLIYTVSYGISVAFFVIVYNLLTKTFSGIKIEVRTSKERD